MHNMCEMSAIAPHFAHETLLHILVLLLFLKFYIVKIMVFPR